MIRKKLKILHIILSKGFAGSEKYVVDLVHFQKKKHFVSYNVILTKNIELFLRKISSEDYIFICNKDGFDYFNKLYKNYLKSKNNIFLKK